MREFVATSDIVILFLYKDIFGDNEFIFYPLLNDRAVEMTEACVYDKTHHCSMFGKGAVNYAMTEMKNKATETRKLSCTDSLDLCMMKFYYSSLGVLQGEIMMTKLSKMRDHVTSQVLLIENCVVEYRISVSKFSAQWESQI